LAAVYNLAQTGAIVTPTNTAVDLIFLGTPVVPALAVDSLVISNLVASGDILLAANNGGNSQAWLWVDSSAGTMTLYAAGVEQLRTALGAFVINESSADIDFRVETDGMQYAFYSDGGKNALVLGSNTDTSNVDRLITISRAARTATASTAYYDLAIQPAGAVSTSGTTPTIAALQLQDPNITKVSGTITNATTLYIASQPTEGDTTNSAIFFGAAANIAATTSLTFNEDAVDIDFRFEGDNNANMLVLDGGTDSMAFGSAVTAGAFSTLGWAAVNRTLVTSVGAGLHIAAATITDQAGNGTTAIGSLVYLGIPTLASSAATRTYTAAATLYIAGAPAAGSQAAVTAGYSLWVDAGDVRFDGDITLDGNTVVNVGAGTQIALGFLNNTYYYILGTRLTTGGAIVHTFDTEDWTLASAAGANGTLVSLAAHTFSYTGNTQVTSTVETMTIAARTLAADGVGGALTIDTAVSLRLSAPIESTNVVLGSSIAIRITDSATTATNHHGIYIDTLTGGVTQNNAIDIASSNPIRLEAANDLIFPANTAAALELSDGTTKLYTVDTRNTVTVQNHVFDMPASQTLPNGATSQYRAVSIAAHTVTLAGTTQVTTVNQGAGLWIGAPTYNQSGGAVVVDQVSTLHVATAVAGASVTITANRMISTGVADCYLTGAGVWTDTACTAKYKQDIRDLDMDDMPGLLEQIRPVTFKYDPEKRQENDFNRQRYGVVAEELPDFLRPPGDRGKSAMNGTVLGAFGLAAIRYLYEENKVLSAKLTALGA